MDMCDKSAGFRKHSTWQSRLQEKWQQHQNGRTASRPRRRPAAEAPNVKKLSGRLQGRGCEAACRSGPARRDGSAAAIACSKLPTLTHGALVTEQLVTFAVELLGLMALTAQSHLKVSCWRNTDEDILSPLK